MREFPIVQYIMHVHSYLATRERTLVSSVNIKYMYSEKGALELPTFSCALEDTCDGGKATARSMMMRASGCMMHMREMFLGSSSEFYDSDDVIYNFLYYI